MVAERDIEQAVEACLNVYEAIKRHGTLEMQATVRILLFQIGQEVARRQVESKKEFAGR